MSDRYGCLWPDGTYTGGITESYRDAQTFAKQHDGTVYTVGSEDDPEKETRHAPAEHP